MHPAKLSDSPKVSVIIPTYNRATLLPQAIQSVFNQTFSDLEIIVVDDGSSDNTREVLAPYRDRILYVYQQHQGAASARNTGIVASRGRYLAFLDSDDLYVPSKLEKQVRILSALHEVSVVYSNYSHALIDGTVIKHMAVSPRRFKSGKIFEEVLLRKAMFGSVPTWLVRKECFDATGYFKTDLKMSEDRDISLRLAQKFLLYGISEPLVVVRQTPGSLGRCSASEREYYRSRFLEHFYTEFKDDPIAIRNKSRVLADYEHMAGTGYLREGNDYEAQKRFLKSILLRPFYFPDYLFFLLCFLRLATPANEARKALVAFLRHYHRKS